MGVWRSSGQEASELPPALFDFFSLNKDLELFRHPGNLEAGFNDPQGRAYGRARSTQTQTFCLLHIYPPHFHLRGELTLPRRGTFCVIVPP